MQKRFQGRFDSLLNTALLYFCTCVLIAALGVQVAVVFCLCFPPPMFGLLWQAFLFVNEWNGWEDSSRRSSKSGEREREGLGGGAAILMNWLATRLCQVLLMGSNFWARDHFPFGAGAALLGCSMSWVLLWWLLALVWSYLALMQPTLALSVCCWIMG